MNMVLSAQGVATDQRQELLAIFYFSWFIDGHGCVIPNGRYVPKGGIPWFFTFLYALKDLVVPLQGSDVYPRGGSIAILYLLICLMNSNGKILSLNFLL